MRMIQFLAALLAVMVMVPAASRAQDDPAPAPAEEGTTVQEPAKQEVPPSFQPGAAVELAITLKAPRDWNLNYMVPIRFEFDEEYLKHAPVSVKQRTWDFEIKSYLPSATFVIPVTLDKDLADGELAVPLPIACSVCESSGESCTFCMETMTINIVVQATAAEGDGKDRAQAKGTLQVDHRLSLP